MSEDAWMADTEELGTEKRQCVSVAEGMQYGEQETENPYGQTP